MNAPSDKSKLKHLPNSGDSNSLFSSVMESLPVHVILKDLDGRITFVNNMVSQLLELPVSDIVGKTDYDLFPAELAEKYRKDDQAVVKSGEPMVAIEENRTGDQRRYVEIRKSPVYDANQTIKGTLVIFWDVTEHKQAEAAVEYERYLLHSLLDNSPDNIYFKDADSHFLRVSKSLVEKFGQTEADEVLGKTDAQFFTEEHARQAMEDEQQVMRTGQPILGKVERETFQDNHETWCSTTKLPLRDGDGRIIGTFGISRDVTEQKQTEQALARERDLLRTLMDALPDLIFVKDAQGRFLTANTALLRTMDSIPLSRWWVKRILTCLIQTLPPSTLPTMSACLVPADRLFTEKRGPLIRWQ